MNNQKNDMTTSRHVASYDASQGASARDLYLCLAKFFLEIGEIFVPFHVHVHSYNKIEPWSFNVQTS